MVALLGENPQQDEWAGRIRCALKLVKLAAGAFDSADVLGTDERSLPSWTIAEPHENSCKAGAAPVLAGAVDPATNNPDSSRSQWSRPWREGPSCRVARWEKAGIVVPRHVTSLSPRSSPPGDGPCEGEIRQICVKIPSVSMLSSPPPRYTTKYFGLVDGALAVMSRADQLEPRPVCNPPGSNGSWNLTQSPRFARAEGEHHHHLGGGGELGERERPRMRKRKMSIGDAVAAAAGAGSPPRSAQKTPQTKPVEGPDPRPWTGSKLKGLQSPSSAGDDHNATDWGSQIMRAADTDFASCSGSSSNGGCTGGMDGDKDVGPDRKGDDGSASSFLSLALGSRSWSVSDDERDRDTYDKDAERASRRWDRKKSSRTNVGGYKVGHRGHMQAEVAPSSHVTATIPTLQDRVMHRHVGDKTGWTHPHYGNIARSGTSLMDNELQLLQIDQGPPLAAAAMATTPSVCGDEATALRMKDGDLTATPRKPEPDLYDFWIPQRKFQGKALATSKRWRRGTDPPESSRSPAAETTGRTSVAGVKACLPVATFLPPQTNTGDSSNRQGAAVSGDFGLAVAAAAAVAATDEEVAASPGPPSPSQPLRHENDELNSEAGESWNPDTLVTDRALVSGNEEGWDGGANDEEKEQIGMWESGVQKHFDYAKRFSWKAAAVAVADASSKRIRALEPHEGEQEQEVHLRREGLRVLQQTLSQEERAAAAERARVRSDHATRVAVDRLRQPQSVFSPLHRTPSRPEMRRSITRGRFSPVGRKLWRRSEGLSPRAGQLCLRAAPPLISSARMPSPPLDAADWASIRFTPQESMSREYSPWDGACAAHENSETLTDEGGRLSEKSMIRGQQTGGVRTMEPLPSSSVEDWEGTEDGEYRTEQEDMDDEGAKAIASGSASSLDPTQCRNEESEGGDVQRLGLFLKNPELDEERTRGHFTEHTSERIIVEAGGDINVNGIDSNVNVRSNIEFSECNDTLHDGHTNNLSSGGRSRRLCTTSLTASDSDEQVCVADIGVEETRGATPNASAIVEDYYLRTCSSPVAWPRSDSDDVPVTLPSTASRCLQYSITIPWNGRP